MKIDSERVVKNIRAGLKQYIEENGLKCLVIGVSGGVDSAVCCALAKPVCDELEIPLIGRSISIESNKADEIDRAKRTGEVFCHNFKEVDYTNLFKYTCECFEKTEVTLDKVARGNIKARIRMEFLYSIAGQRRGIVLSTDNWSEYFLGFFTLCGDVGDLGLIQQLWKDEVYWIADFLAYYDIVLSGTLTMEENEKATEVLNESIRAVPTDGLGISDSDLDQIGAKDYDEVCVILKTWLTKDIDAFHWDDYLEYDGRLDNYDDFVNYRETLKDHPVVQRHERTHFKRNWPINLERRKIFK